MIHWKKCLLTPVALLLLVAPAFAETKTWTYDPVHSSLTWKISHLVVSKTTGTFDKVTGTVLWNGKDAEGASVDLTIEAASINSRNEDRDKHLRSADFFDVEKYPTLTFKSTKIVKGEGGAYTVTGDLTIHGVTKAVTFDLTASEPIKAPFDPPIWVSGFSGKVTIDRRDFGVSWSKALETGGLMLGHEVEIQIEVELHAPIEEAKK